MKQITADRSELALKLIATAAALAVFAVLGAGALYLTPSAPERPTREARHGADTRAEAGRDAGRLPLPSPPDSRRLQSEETGLGNIYLYESRLGAEGIRRFYTTEMARRGWRPAGAPRGAAPELENAMYFTDGTGHCIINIEEKDAYTVRVTLITSDE